MTVLSIPLPIFILLFLPLLFPAFRAVSVRKGRVPFFEVLPVMFFCVLILLALLFHGECGLCRSIPVDGLWLTLSNQDPSSENDMVRGTLKEDYTRKRHQGWQEHWGRGSSLFLG